MWVKKLSEEILNKPDAVCNCDHENVWSDNYKSVNMLDDNMNPSYSIRQCNVCGCMEISEPLMVICNCKDGILQSSEIVVMNILTKDLKPNYALYCCQICGQCEMEPPEIVEPDCDDEIWDYEECHWCSDRDDDGDVVCPYCGKGH